MLVRKEKLPKQVTGGCLSPRSLCGSVLCAAAREHVRGRGGCGYPDGGVWWLCTRAAAAVHSRKKREGITEAVGPLLLEVGKPELVSASIGSGQ